MIAPRNSLYLWLTILLALLTATASPQATAASPAAPATAPFVVDVVGDYPDLVVGNGLCAISGGGCTLRAAIQEANLWPGDDIINFSPAIPTPAVFYLTRAGTDDNALNGDLDITGANGNLTINGAGAALTVIDGNQAVTNDRVFQIMGGTVTITGLTVRNGHASNGAGIYVSPGAVLNL